MYVLACVSHIRYSSSCTSRHVTSRARLLAELRLLHGAWSGDQQTGRRRLRLQGQEEDVGAAVRFRQKGNVASVCIHVTTAAAAAG